MQFQYSFKIPALIAVLSLSLFAACKRESNNILTDGDDNGGYASDASRIELYNNDVISLADAAGTVYNGAYMRGSAKTTFGTCATVGTDTTSNPRVLVIRFNNSDCLDGRRRKGAIVVRYTGSYADTGREHTISFDNYYVNGTQLTGTIKTKRIDTTITGDWYYQVTANDSLNMSQDPLQSEFVIWRGNLVRKQIQGKFTGDRADDLFSISGNATLTRPNGHQFSFGISTPLEFATSCDYAKSGVANVFGLNGARMLNYGTGGCDDDAQLNIDIRVFPIKLQK